VKGNNNAKRDQHGAKPNEEDHMKARQFPGLVHWSGAYPFWDGGPRRELTEALKTLCMTDGAGRRYYRLTAWDGWKRLRNKDVFAYAALNKALERYRLPVRVAY
jgi:hypothetical protein